MGRMDTLTELCEYLKNFFDDGCAVYSGKISVAEGTVTCSRDLFNSVTVPLEVGQFFRVTGSVFDDGVHCYPDMEMRDGSFEGSIQPMRVPNAVLHLAHEISEWKEKYEAVDSTAMSPYTSESFAGYSYSKNVAGSTDGASGWQSVFKSRLKIWRKI